MPYGYLDNNARMEGIQSIGQTAGGLAYALPQLQIQAQLFRQRMALQRAQELLNQQRMQESEARAKLYQKEGERTEAQTQHVQGQEGRDRELNIARGAYATAMRDFVAAQQSPGGQGPFTSQQDALQQAMQAASFLSAQNPERASAFLNQMQAGPKPIATRPGEVLVSPQGNPIYTNQQPQNVSMGNLATAAFNALPINQQRQVAPQIMSRSGISNVAPGSVSGPSLPSIGEVRRGYRFKGGDPSMKDNWEAVQ